MIAVKPGQVWQWVEVHKSYVGGGVDMSGLFTILHRHPTLPGWCFNEKTTSDWFEDNSFQNSNIFKLIKDVPMQPAIGQVWAWAKGTLDETYDYGEKELGHFKITGNHDGSGWRYGGWNGDPDANNVNGQGWFSNEAFFNGDLKYISGPEEEPKLVTNVKAPNNQQELFPVVGEQWVIDSFGLFQITKSSIPIKCEPECKAHYLAINMLTGYFNVPLCGQLFTKARAKRVHILPMPEDKPTQEDTEDFNRLSHIE